VHERPGTIRSGLSFSYARVVIPSKTRTTFEIGQLLRPASIVSESTSSFVPLGGCVSKMATLVQACYSSAEIVLHLHAAAVFGSGLSLVR
jgi:hypothetical protein